MTMPFGPEGQGEVFKYSLFLVLCNRLTTCAVAIVMLVVGPPDSRPQQHKPFCMLDPDSRGVWRAGAVHRTGQQLPLRPGAVGDDGGVPDNCPRAV